MALNLFPLRLVPIIADLLRRFAAMLAMLVVPAAFFGTAQAQNGFADFAEVEPFIVQMVEAHQYDRAQLERLFHQARMQNGVLQAMARPATARPWFEFRASTITAARLREGIEYWRRHAAALERASATFGVPAEIIVATIGIETVYGRALGKGRVFDALATLAFAHPPRAALFRNELIELLLLSREMRVDPLHYRGSFAGALGVPQFLPSSYRRYAVDFDGNGRRDLWTHADAIGSIANYYRSYGWATGQPVLSALERTNEAPSDAFKQMLERGIQPHSSVEVFRKAGASIAGIADDDVLACAFAAETETGTAYWLGFNNFYVITRYNRSVNYALAVYELAWELRRLRDDKFR